MIDIFCQHGKVAIDCETCDFIQSVCWHIWGKTHIEIIDNIKIAWQSCNKCGMYREMNAKNKYENPPSTHFEA